VIVDDGSVDATASVIAEYAQRRSQVKQLSLSENSGKSAAIKAGIAYIAGNSEFNSIDYVVFTDGDMQLHPKYLDSIAEKARELNVDMLVASRNLSKYPPVKRWGNKFLSWQASLLSGFKWSDSLCGLRCVRRERLGEVYEAISGGGYCCEQDMCVSLPLRGFKVSCDFLIEVEHLRSNSRIFDAFSIFFSGLKCWFREKVL
ncbi:glycosyltransferase family 2 protein, partial [bacterium]|nr:glycosyltransferase family 2 protein [bacterium]